MPTLLQWARYRPRVTATIAGAVVVAAGGGAAAGYYFHGPPAPEHGPGMYRVTNRSSNPDLPPAPTAFTPDGTVLLLGPGRAKHAATIGSECRASGDTHAYTLHEGQSAIDRACHLRITVVHVYRMPRWSNDAVDIRVVPAH